MPEFLIGSLGVTGSTLVGALILDFAIQWVAWAFACTFKTEKFYDALGSTGFISVTIATLTYTHFYYPRQIIASIFVILWALRLGSFLLFRVLKTGKDSRFEGVLDKPAKFFVYWTLQAVWIYVTLLPVIVLNGTQRNKGLWASDIIGGIIWAIGLGVEATADQQKYNFKMNPNNKGKFVNTGLWSLCRYPNYFGEFCVWLGIWLFCIPSFRGGYWAATISPIWVVGQIMGLSGVPLQEKQQKERWGDDPAFQEYRRNTWLLLPLPKPGKKKGRSLSDNEV
jgi:steroid 5-alpha reductase family enzyme